MRFGRLFNFFTVLALALVVLNLLGWFEIPFASAVTLSVTALALALLSLALSGAPASKPTTS